MKTRSSPDRELTEAVAFALLPRVGCGAFREGVERFGSAAAAFREHGTSPQRREALAAAKARIAAADAVSSTLLVQGEGGYPAVLLDLPDPPCLLHALGDADLLQRRCVGIVGTRHSSAGGERIAHRMAALLVEAGAVVVSGMAFGIDAAAHRGALDAGGGTVAVLGGGVDVPYPPSHAALHARIASAGLVLSEAPVGAHPSAGAFPRRNRIIAALSEMLVVIEAGDRSGALITSRIALELGRTVAAVPGPIDSPRHTGSNRLLRDGAAFIGDIEDVLLAAGLGARRAVEAQAAPLSGDPEPSGTVDPSHAAILNAVMAGASELEDLARSTRLSPREFATALSTLELAGQLLVTPGGNVSLFGRA